jgi:seryl-tRNA synthetase
MLDIQFIRENADRVKQNVAAKNVKVDVDALLQADEKRRGLLQQIEPLRQERNALADSAKGQKPTDEQIAKGKQLKEKLTGLEDELQKVGADYTVLLADIPNIIPQDTPEGGEEANREEKKWGDTSEEGFEVKDHQTWAEEKGLLDFERGAKVAGNKFYFTKGSLVELELAMFQFGLSIAAKHGFLPMMVPHMTNARTTAGTGFMPRGEEKQIYSIDGEDLNLIATAEIPLTGYHADEILDLAEPKLFAGLSPAYRMEAGAYGKHSRGLYRVHQFDKLELYVICRPEESEQWHQRLVEIEEEICQQLGIPYRLVRIAAGDLGGPAYKKFDIEYWSPVDKSYRELMSCSNVTDYQARRLNIRYRTPEGGTAFVHTLNGTAAAISRVIIAIVENYQTAEGKVLVPKALKPYMQNREQL